MYLFTGDFQNTIYHLSKNNVIAVMYQQMLNWTFIVLSQFG